MMKNNTTNLIWSDGEIKYEHRCKVLNQKGLIIWFTGISGSGKSTIALEVEKDLINKGMLTYRLDGDNIRHGLCSDLGFSTEDRNENVRRVAEVAALFKDAGIITLVSLISPFEEMRKYARSRVDPTSFIEVYLKVDLETCIRRDPKGLYKKAISGQISHFTGISSAYEEPLAPELTIDTSQATIVESRDIVLRTIINVCQYH
jgi:adenylylsulfate kinase